MIWKIAVGVIIYTLYLHPVTGTCDLCEQGFFCYKTECIELPRLTTPPIVTRSTCGVLSVMWRGWRPGRDLGDPRISHYILQRSTEVNSETWVVFSRYNHYFDDQLFMGTFEFPERSPRQRFRVDVYLAINQSIIDAFVPGSPSDFLSANCLVCPEGLFGEDCSRHCNCRDNTTCNAENGACRYGCRYGFAGLSCSIVLPTLLSPPMIYLGEECGKAEVTWVPGNFTDLDRRILIHSYQVDYQEVGAPNWSIVKEMYTHYDSIFLYSSVISNLRPGGEFRFRVNIRVSQSGELLSEYTLGPVSDPVVIQCGEMSTTATTQSTTMQPAVTSTTQHITTTTRHTSTTKRLSTTTNTYTSTTKRPITTIRHTLTTKQPTTTQYTATVQSTMTERIGKLTTTTTPITTQPLITQTTTISRTPLTKLLISPTTVPIWTTSTTESQASSTSWPTSTTPMQTIWPTATTTRQMSTTSLITSKSTQTTAMSTTFEKSFLDKELELMVSNLSVVSHQGSRALLATWRLDDRFTYLMTSGALLFRMIAVGNCYKTPAINWTTYPLTMEVREFRIPVWENWRTYKIRIEYYQYSDSAFLPSTELDFTTPNHEPMKPAENVSVINITSTSIKVKWTAPICAYRGSDVINYTCTLSNMQSQTSVQFETQNVSAEINRLKPFRKYSLVVTIHNEVGPGPSTAPLTLQTLEDVPGPPTIIKLSPLLSTAIVVIFAPPIEANGIITKYMVSVLEEVTSNQLDVETYVTSVTIKNLSAYTSYQIKVKARTNAGWGGYSTDRTVTTLEEIPGSPTDFRVTLQSETTIGVQWTSPNFTRGIIKGFKVSYRRGSSNVENFVFYEFHSATSNVNISGLESGEYYHFRVQARSGAGDGLSVNQSTFTLPDTPPRPPVPRISYRNQKLTLTLLSSIVNVKHFYTVRVYVDDVSVSREIIPEEETAPTGTVILILDRTDIAQNVIYILGDNSTRHGVQNSALHFNHTYIFYLEIVTRFENFLKSNHVRHPDVFSIGLMNDSLEGSSTKQENESDLSGIIVGVVFGVFSVPAAASICIVARRLKNRKDTNSNVSNKWMRNIVLGRSNSMHSTCRSQNLDILNNSLPENTGHSVTLSNQRDSLKRVSSFQSSNLKNHGRQNTNKRNIKRSLSDTEMMEKNNLYRAYDVILSKSISQDSKIGRHRRNESETTLERPKDDAEISKKELKPKAPPKPARRRLHRSSTGSRLDELKRRTCSPIQEEDHSVVFDVTQTDSTIQSHYSMSRPDFYINPYEKVPYMAREQVAYSAKAADIDNQGFPGNSVVKRTKIKRTRRIIASRAMSENKKAAAQRTKQEHSNAYGDGQSTNSQFSGRLEDDNEIDSTRRKRPRKLRRSVKRKSESVRINKAFQGRNPRRSMSFSDTANSIPSNLYGSCESELDMKSFIAKTSQHQGEYESLESSDCLENSVTKSNIDRRFKSRSLRDSERSMRRELREQDILKFWSKTYSFLDERKIITHQETLEDYKARRFFEDDRPQTVSLELEFRSLPTGALGTSNVARQKARVPAHKLCLESYDHSRVILKPEGPDDYINASFIKDRIHEGAARYIASRTPHDEESTIRFWRMILQEGTRVIVKLSQQPDIFPSVIPCTSGPVAERFRLTHHEDVALRGCLVRYFRLTNVLDHSSRGIYIVHDLLWPDDDRYYLPHNAKDFISLRDVVRKCMGGSSGPVVVHCSQEDGRSGVFIAVDALLSEYEKQREVNIFSFVRNMLKDRYGLIKTIWQYRFIYEAILEAHLKS